jgi:hypothetical protein
MENLYPVRLISEVQTPVFVPKILQQNIIDVIVDPKFVHLPIVAFENVKVPNESNHTEFLVLILYM